MNRHFIDRSEVYFLLTTITSIEGYTRQKQFVVEYIL